MGGFRKNLPTLFRSRKGNAAIEFALTFPTMVVITLLIFDLGRALFVYTTINNVAAEGARYAAVHGSSNVYEKTADEIEEFIVSRAAGLFPANLTITVTYDPNIAFKGSTVEVLLVYNMDLFLGGVFETIINADASLTLSGKSTMDVL